MASPRHIPTALSDYTIKLTQDASVYNAQAAVFPTKNVSKKSDDFFIYDVKDSFRRGDTVCANKTPAKRVDFASMDIGTYVLKNHKLNMAISKEDVENSDASVNPEMDALEELTSMLLLDKEVDAAEKCFTTTAISQNTTLTTNKWSYDTTTSNPIDDVDTAISTIMKATGKKADNMLIGFSTWQTLKDHSEILDRVKWSQVGIIPESLAAGCMGLKNLIVNQTIGQTLAYGISSTCDYVFNNNALVFYNEKPGMRIAALGTTFVGIYGDVKPEVRTYRDEDIDSDVIEVAWMYDQKIALTASGYLIAGVN